MNEHAATTPTVPPAVKYGGTAIYVDDVPAALDFYRRAFGLETRFFDEALQYGDLQTGGALVAFASHRLGEMLMPGHHAQGRPAGVELGFIAHDVPAAFAKAVAAGALPLAEPKVMPWGATVAYLRSPDGTILGLSTPIPGQAETVGLAEAKKRVQPKR